MSRSRSSKRLKVAGVVALVLAALGVGGATIALRAQDAESTSAGPTSVTDAASATPSADPVAAPSSTPVNPPPPNPDDVATDTATPDGVSVQITYATVDDAAGGVTVGAYVAGLVEDGGTCSLLLTQGDRALSADSVATADASTTSCGLLLVPADSAGPGTWTAEVSYASPAGGDGVRSSATTTVDVP